MRQVSGGNLCWISVSVYFTQSLGVIRTSFAFLLLPGKDLRLDDSWE